MGVVIRRWREKRCRHRMTTSARSMGMERAVCDACGMVSFRCPESETTQLMGVDRVVFARPGDLIEDPPPGRHKV